jgi:hypothetical protein
MPRKWKPDFKPINSEELRAAMDQTKRASEDKRRLRGKHAPKTGTCVVCKGKIVAEIHFPSHGPLVLGGPPLQGYVRGWHCESCGLSYHHLPKGK